MDLFLLLLLFLPACVASFLWSRGKHRALYELQAQSWRQAGFTQDTSPTTRAALQAAWGRINCAMFVRQCQGYRLWCLKRPVRKGGSSAFLLITFDDPPTLPEAYLVGAHGAVGSLLHKPAARFAKAQGYPHALSVPPPFAERWWAFGQRPQWLPSSPSARLWSALEEAPSLTLRMKPQGIEIDGLACIPSTKMVDPPMLALVDRIAQACMR